MRTLGLTLMMGALALTGCATSGERLTAMESDNGLEVDQLMVSQVNRVARTRGVKVIWVHRPRKKVFVADNG